MYSDNKLLSVGGLNVIFLCFSIKDRETIAEKILNHLLSFGFEVWYDRKDIFLGDNRFDANLKNGAGGSNIKYAVIIISENFQKGDYCNRELNILWQRKLKNEVSIFPIFYNMPINQIPKNFQFLLEFVCKFISNSDESIFTAYHIVSKITDDLLKKTYDKTFQYYANNCQDNYITEIIILYLSMDRSNYNSKMTILYLLYTYIKSTKDFSQIPSYYYFGFEKLYSFTKLNINTDLRELQILENLSLLLLNSFYK